MATPASSGLTAACRRVRLPQPDSYFRRLIDQGAASAATNLFTDDAEMGGPGNRLAAVTRSGTCWLRAKPTPVGKPPSGYECHVRTDRPDTAIAHSLLSVFVLGVSEEPTISALSEFDDEFARDADGRWRFARRQATVLAGSR